jgi:hypothetical protein
MSGKHQRSNPSDNNRMVWEMRNYRQYYRNHTPNLTPSSTVLNSPIMDDDFRIIDQYQKVTNDNKEISDNNGLCVLDSTEGASNFYSDKDIVVFDDIDDSRNMWNNSRYENRLVTGFSPTSSQSSQSGNASAGTDVSSGKNRIIGELQIADLQGSPRRFGSNHLTEQQSPELLNIDKSPRLALHSPVNFPKRAPGFPKVFHQKKLFLHLVMIYLKFYFSESYHQFSLKQTHLVQQALLNKMLTCCNSNSINSRLILLLTIATNFPKLEKY